MASKSHEQRSLGSNLDRSYQNGSSHSEESSGKLSRKQRRRPSIHSKGSHGSKEKL